MAYKIDIYSTQTLIDVARTFLPVSNYWLDLCFPNEVHFTTEYIDFEQLSNVRRVAPFVMPMAQGRPIYSEGSRVTRMKPAYVKAKDAISPVRVVKKAPGTLSNIGMNQSPREIYDRLVGNILQAHDDAIQRRWEWMACRAIVDAAIVISGEAYPTRALSFGRDGNHNVTLSGGAVWGAGNTVGPLDTLDLMQTTMRRSLFGGAYSRVTMDPLAWALFKQSPSIVEMLKFGMYQFAGGLNPNLGIRNGGVVENVGAMSGSVETVVYNDYYQDGTGAQVNFLEDNTVVLTGPGVDGYRCFGAILDPNAEFQALSIFPRMFTDDDPPNTFIMTQSAPLMVPLNPNNTAKINVA